MLLHVEVNGQVSGRHRTRMLLTKLRISTNAAVKPACFSPKG